MKLCVYNWGSERQKNEKIYAYSENASLFMVACKFLKLCCGHAN